MKRRLTRSPAPGSTGDEGLFAIQVPIAVVLGSQAEGVTLSQAEGVTLRKLISADTLDPRILVSDRLWRQRRWVQSHGMARKLRLEFPGAIYHVINRGNYRRWIFKDLRTRLAFEACLFEACKRSGWLLHAFVIMGNHYHLAVETPQGNLVAGMQWLQSTFANRFNRLRDEHGHLFQGRYKSLLIEEGDALGQVCHYIHLNPVRAKLVPMDKLASYRSGSYWFLKQLTRRPDFLKVETALQAAGGLTDSRAGRRCYEKYLDWQATDGPAGRTKAYVNLSRGWALGSREFKLALVRDHNVPTEARAWEKSGAREVNELLWAEQLKRALFALDKTPADATRDRKSATWKLAIATWLKTHTQISNGWLASRLNLGVPAALSRNLTRYRRSRTEDDRDWKRLKSISAA